MIEILEKWNWNWWNMKHLIKSLQFCTICNSFLLKGAELCNLKNIGTVGKWNI